MIRVFINKLQSSSKNLLSFILKDHKLPNGRWVRADEYNGNMSYIAQANSDFNNHDHCGGDLCRFPPSKEQ